MGNNKLGIAAAVGGSFTCLAGLIIFLMIRQTLRFEIATLMLVALLGMYFGFGILIAAYLMVRKLK